MDDRTVAAEAADALDLPEGATSPLDWLASGRRTIEIEITAMKALRAALAHGLGDAFCATVGLLRGIRGRVIVTGVGKSGHIGCKLAATLASTGTPAFFVHAAEASHGDLGMITREDVVILLSNSGETPELADMIVYTRRFGIPLIGVAGRAESTLIAQADIGLVLPEAPEACSAGLAPTTSTTMTLALGDALAVALMEHRAFGPEDFREFHPGGRLGARLVTVGALMHAGEALPLVPLGASMPDALLVMSQKGFGVVGVVTETELVGVITDGDLRRNMAGLLERRVADVMTRVPRTIATTALASEALGIMNAAKITTLFATPPEAPRRAVGILHVHDCLRAGVV